MMKFHRIAPAALVLAAGAAVLAAGPLTDTQRKSAEAYLETAREKQARVAQLESYSGRLNTLDSAIYNLKRARSIVVSRDGEIAADLRARVDDALVDALLDQAEIYYVRKSFALARKRIADALAIESGNQRALSLADRVVTAESRGLFDDETFGTVAARRILQRRNIGVPVNGRLAGVPLRDRNVFPNGTPVRQDRSQTNPSPSSGSGISPAGGANSGPSGGISPAGGASPGPGGGISPAGGRGR
jgi:hypothetical protein